MTPEEHTFEEILVGQSATTTQTFTDADVAAFAKLSGDYSPLHLDAMYAAQTSFARPIVHGMFLGALCSRIIGMQLPGKRALYLDQTLRFTKPVYIGDAIVAVGTVTAKSQATRIIEIAFVFSRGTERVAEGNAHVQVRDL